ncbi:MAG: tetratricopeptide repeat protein [Thermoleophilia bacterium]|nr:tetratricopeptide repeat protein [Thermoleophilia bacterium]
MLLDRKKVKFWQRIIFGGMAFLMAAFLVVGYSGALSSCQRGGGIGDDPVEQLDDEIAALEQQLRADETDVALWGELGDTLMSRGNAQQDLEAREADWRKAVIAYERQATLLEEQEGAETKAARREVLETLADVYLTLQDYEMAVNVYGQLTSLAPKEAKYFLVMGEIAASIGDTDRALLAYTRYLQLEPDSADAEFVKDWIAANSPDGEGTP